MDKFPKSLFFLVIAAAAAFVFLLPFLARQANASSHLAAPLVVKQGYGLGARFTQGSDSDASWNKAHFDFTFRFEGSTGNLSSFHFYEKRPGASGFSRIAEFKNLLAVSGNTYDKSGTWALSRLESTWIIKKFNTALLTTLPVPLYESPSAYPPGIYSYYVAAADSYGNESPPSQIFNIHVLQQFDVVALTPQIEWTSVFGWPENQILYIMKLHDGTSVVWSKTEINRENKATYGGPALDAGKTYKAFIIAQWSSSTLKPLDLYHAFSTDKPTPMTKPTPSPVILIPLPSPSPSPLPSPAVTPKPTIIPTSKPTSTPKPTPTAKLVPTPKPTMPEQKEIKPTPEIPPLPSQASETAEEKRPESPPRAVPQGVFSRVSQIFRGLVDLFISLFK